MAPNSVSSVVDGVVSPSVIETPKPVMSISGCGAAKSPLILNSSKATPISRFQLSDAKITLNLT